MPKKKTQKGLSTKGGAQYAYIDPDHIRFTHSKISPNFSGCGRPVEQTLEDIKSGRLTAADLPITTVIRRDDETYFSLNNRRLWVIKQCRSLGLLPDNTIQVRVRDIYAESRKIQEKYSTDRNFSATAKFATSASRYHKKIDHEAKERVALLGISYDEGLKMVMEELGSSQHVRVEDNKGTSNEQGYEESDEEGNDEEESSEDEESSEEEEPVDPAIDHEAKERMELLGMSYEAAVKMVTEELGPSKRPPAKKRVEESSEEDESSEEETDGSEDGDEEDDLTEEQRTQQQQRRALARAIAHSNSNSKSNSERFHHGKRRQHKHHRKVQRTYLLQTDGEECFICQETMTQAGETIGTAVTVDHLLPLHRGGTNHIDNMVLTCKICNEDRSNKYPTKGELRRMRKLLKKRKKFPPFSLDGIGANREEGSSEEAEDETTVEQRQKESEKAQEALDEVDEAIERAASRNIGFAALDLGSSDEEEEEEEEVVEEEEEEQQEEDDEDDEDEDEDPMAAVLTAIYQKHNPEKLKDQDFVARTLTKYAGREQLLLAALNKKYGTVVAEVAPKVPAKAAAPARVAAPPAAPARAVARMQTGSNKTKKKAKGNKEKNLQEREQKREQMEQILSW
jgi:5-methylcytosine-specific restriction endonuclease McrA